MPRSISRALLNLPLVLFQNTATIQTITHALTTNPYIPVTPLTLTVQIQFRGPSPPLLVDSPRLDFVVLPIRSCVLRSAVPSRTACRPAARRVGRLGRVLALVGVGGRARRRDCLRLRRERGKEVSSLRISCGCFSAVTFGVCGKFRRDWKGRQTAASSCLDRWYADKREKDIATEYKTRP
ncbi:hypothetical protein BDY21DRAFT_216765 [Lineolata rhizophorae]|uniref:Uncharacterized protein n=1 Tax=Lineolata rhizophorae TaxID=578093 RepID=A0A6A6P2M8_9PEZI|nr:hypothetical protein BDY21DRAFT_216765 [Lineolata rhizophorae]